MFVSSLLAGVPCWVWILLAVLVWQGCLAVRDNTVPMSRILLLPVIFIAWGVTGLVTGAGGTMAPYAVWALAAACFVVIGMRIGPRRMTVDAGRRLVHRDGSVWPLVRNIVLFGVQFGIGMGLALRPDLHGDLLLLRSAVSGAMAGWFGGWLVVFWQRYARMAFAP